MFLMKLFIYLKIYYHPEGLEPPLGYCVTREIFSTADIVHIGLNWDKD